MLMGSLCAVSRTGMAVSSFIIGLYFLSKGKRLWYILILLFASLFHTSSLIFLPIVFIFPRPIKLNPFIAVVAMVLLAVISAVIPDAWSSVVESLLTSNNMLEGYMNYMEAEAAHYTLNLKIPFFVFWGYILVKNASFANYTNRDYLLLKCALITVLLHLLPGLGLSSRLYYFADYAFFGGMMLSLNNTSNKTERIVLLTSLFFIFGREFLLFWSSPYFKEFWMVYHPFWQ